MPSLQSSPLPKASDTKNKTEFNTSVKKMDEENDGETDMRK